MINELNALEGKVAAVVSLCRTLRTENAELKQQLQALAIDRDGLVQRMDQARVRIEQLAEQLPEAKTGV
jgi:cell division protein ZapB